MNLVRPPFWLPWLYPGSVWNLKAKENFVYLTFDDGPIPNVTPWVLDQLAACGVKATFFCIGKNVAANPEIFKRISDEGHETGNHTMTHVNGWKTDFDNYMAEVDLCGNQVQSHLFRPPYGKLSFRQFRNIRKKYKVVFWDVLTEDYNKERSGADCIRNVLENIRPGSVIVFHDSLKAEERLKAALPVILKEIPGMGYKFRLLGDTLMPAINK